MPTSPSSLDAVEILRLWNASERKWVHGKDLFMLHDTYGLPFGSMLHEIQKRGYRADVGGLRAELKCNYGWEAAKIDSALQD